jgi:hypothetical protein
MTSKTHRRKVSSICDDNTECHTVSPSTEQSSRLHATASTAAAAAAATATATASVSDADPNPYELIPISHTLIFMTGIVHIVLYVITGLILSFVLQGFPWWTLLVSMPILEIIAIYTHVLGHTRVIKWWYEAHTIGHHIRDYPAKRFLRLPSQQRPHDHIDNRYAYLPAFVISPTIATFAQNYVVSTLGAMPGNATTMWIVSFVCGLLLLKLADELHDLYHLSGTSFEKYWWFQQLRAIHFLHHKGSMKHNYAIGGFWTDYYIIGMCVTLADL